MVVRANVDVTNEPLGDQRGIFSGSLDQIKSDIQTTKNLGADEMHFDPTFSPEGTSLEGFLKSLEQLKEVAEGV